MRVSMLALSTLVSLSGGAREGEGSVAERGRLWGLHLYGQGVGIGTEGAIVTGDHDIIGVLDV